MVKNDVLKECCGTEGDEASDVMTIAEIARYLKIPERIILKMAKANEIPSTKVSSEWRFLRPLIDDWLSSKMQTTTDDDLVSVIRTARPIVPVSRLVSRDRIVMDMEPGTKEHVLRQLVHPLESQNILARPEDFLKRVLDRESVVSTGIEKGIAIPHARNPETSGVMATCIVLGICREGTDFGALLGGKTYVFFLLCSSSVVAHIRLVAKVTLMLRVNGMVKRLCSAATSEDVLRVLMDSDTALSMSF